MRQILVQDRQTRFFLGPGDQWTILRTEARNFGTSLSAISHCLQKEIPNAQVVVNFDTPGACDVVVPIQEDATRVAA